MATLKKAMIGKKTRSAFSAARVLWAAALLLLCLPASSQTPADRGEWSGSIQCQLDVQGQGYSRHEVQTWTLAGGPPSGQGAGRQYPATWSVSGNGSVQRMQGPQSTAVKWEINVPPMSAPLAIFVRNSDRNLVIKQATPPRFIPNGISGVRQVTINGVPQPAGQVGHPVREWSFGWIAAPSESTNVSDSSSVDTDGLPAEIMQPSGLPRAAVCKWQFTRGGASSDLTPVSQNCSQAVAATVQTFEALKGSVTREYDVLIRQTQDPTRAASLNSEKQRLLRELENLKQQNIAAANRACNPSGGAITTQDLSGPVTPGGNSGQTIDTGQNPTTNGGATTSNPTGETGSGSTLTSDSGSAPVKPNHTDFAIPKGALAGGSSNVPINPIQVDPSQKRAPTATPDNLQGAFMGLNVKDPASGTGAPPPPTTSGRYLITVSGVECIIPTLDSPTDGKGNEIYPAVYWRRYDRRVGINSMDSAEVETQAYGDINQAPDRIQGGTVSPLGGIGPTNFIPDKTSATEKRTLTPNDGRRFPLRIWEGPLTDGVDVLVISPSVWESDGNQTVTAQWLQNQTNLSESLLQSSQLRSQISGQFLGVIDIGATPSPLATLNLFGGGYDRPIGLVANDLNTTALPNRTLVLTREIIEAALGGTQAGKFSEGVSRSALGSPVNRSQIDILKDAQATTPDNSAPQGSSASAGSSPPQNWKLLKIDFMDKAIGPTLGADAPGYFVMYVQIERE